MRSAIGVAAGAMAALVAGCGASDASAPLAGGADAGPRIDDATWGADGYYRDDAGRAVLLRGVNVAHSSKRSADGLPWVQPSDLATLRADWGANLIRLTVFWRFVEPTRGSYDAAYVAAVRERLDWAEAAGISVLLDMHQDLYGFEATDESEGDGPPAWARDATCAPFADKSPWYTNYFEEPVDCQFRSFWADTNGVQTAFVAMWEHLLGAVGDHPALVGVDLWNEPWVPKTATAAGVLAPFYERIMPRVRAAAPRMVVFYEPGTLSGQGQNQAPPRPAYDRVVFAPHFYPPAIWVGAPYRGTLDDVRPQLEQQIAQAKDARVPLVVSEWGAQRDGVGYEAYVGDLLHAWQDAWVGSARWSYDRDSYRFALLAADGTAPASSTAMIEPYAERVPGTPLGSTLAASEKRLTVRFQSSEAADAWITCPSRFCAAEPRLTATLDGAPVQVAGTWDAARARLSVACTAAGRYELSLGW